MKKIKKLLCIALVISLAATVLAACGPKEKELQYTGTVLAAGTVGEAYAPVLIATATGEGSPVISYALKSGSNLPAGLTLSDGRISGTPAAAAAAAEFVVVASAAGYKNAEASFTITINEPVEKINSFAAVATDLDGFVGGGIFYGGYFDGPTVIEKTGTGEAAYATAGTTGQIAGYFLQGTHRTPPEPEKRTITWIIHSDAAVTATLKISLGMEIVGTFSMSSGTGGGGHIFKVNDTPLVYGGITLSRASFDVPINFQLYTIGEIQLKAGDNIITLTLGVNDWVSDGVPGGPALDSIVIDTSATLGWGAGLPKWDNILYKFPNDPLPQQAAA